MSVENVKKFMKQVAEDESLQAQVKAAEAAYAGDKDDHEATAKAIIIPVATKAGLPFTVDELKAAQKEAKASKLSDSDLEKVAGGSSYSHAGEFGVCATFGLGLGEDCIVLGWGLCALYGWEL